MTSEHPMTSGFDPAWKGGHVAVTESGVEKPARIIASDAKGALPIVALVLEGTTEFAIRFPRDGGMSDMHTLKNKPLPRREPSRGLDWVVRWREQIGHTDDVTRYAAYETQDAAKERAAQLVNAWNASNIAIIRVPWTEGMGLPCTEGLAP